jgi:hypothetical protein
MLCDFVGYEFVIGLNINDVAKITHIIEKANKHRRTACFYRRTTKKPGTIAGPGHHQQTKT